MLAAGMALGPYLSGGDPLIEEAIRLWGQYPSVPIQIVNPSDIYDQTRRSDPRKPTAFVLPPYDKIYVSRDGSPYRKKRAELIAAVLAHEQSHLTNGPDEKRAYKAQLDLVERLRKQKKWQDREYLQQLRLFAQ